MNKKNNIKYRQHNQTWTQSKAKRAKEQNVLVAYKKVPLAIGTKTKVDNKKQLPHLQKLNLSSSLFGNCMTFSV